MIDRLEQGGKKAIAGALANLEAADGVRAQAALLDEAVAARRAHVIGITGPPGAGKSTAINRLVQAFRARHESVAVVAIDPTSKRTGGALLGDRNRFDLDPADKGILVRSLAAREQLGGLAEAAIGAVVLLAALYDRVIVETVGVGQSETDIAGLADSVVVVVQPASGDSLQFMKAGIMEIPDIAVVTKADLGDVAERAARDLAIASRARSAAHAWNSPTLKIAATRAGPESGIDAWLEAIDRHFRHLSERGDLAGKRRLQLRQWQEQLLGAWYGRRSLQFLRPLFQNNDRPFAELARLSARCDEALRTAWPEASAVDLRP